MRAIGENAAYRACRNGAGRLLCAVLGTTFYDARRAFAKPQLRCNDAYRDRLLADEIDDLVDLCDALALSLAQRRALFECFRHLDFLRRATIARDDLLRYCNLRPTLATAFLLPASHRASHRRDAQRWDITQLLAAAFSVCTLDVGTVSFAIAWRTTFGATMAADLFGCSCCRCVCRRR